jgi:hypothetical protein
MEPKQAKAMTKHIPLSRIGHEIKERIVRHSDGTMEIPDDLGNLNQLSRMGLLYHEMKSIHANDLCRG